MATTQKIQWETTTNGVFVHSDLGSNLYGNGTKENPYQTLKYAQKQSGSTIYCKGYFSEELGDGNHSQAIIADYPGAAVFDGQGKYHLCGFTHKNMIIINVPAGDEDTIIYATSAQRSPLLAGVGRANTANVVGFAGSVNGVAGSSNIIHNCALYHGSAGGIKGCNYNIYSHLQHNDTHLISFSSQSGSIVNTLKNNIFYYCMVEDRKRAIQPFFHEYCLYSKFALFANETGVSVFTNCIFLADTPWYYYDKVLKKDVRFVIGDRNATSLQYTLNADNTILTIDGVANIDEAIDALIPYANADVTLGSRVQFRNCVFSSHTSEDVFVDAENINFTLKINGAGMTDNILGDWVGFPFTTADTAIIDNRHYYGAMPPAMNIPILTDSAGVPGSWDEKTATGIVAVNDKSEIVIEENNLANGISEGSILTKVIYNGSGRDIVGVFSDFVSHFATHNCVAWQPELLDSTRYYAGDILPKGRYLLMGNVTYRTNTDETVDIDGKSIVVVTKDDTSFTDRDENIKSFMVQYLDANINNVFYIRSVQSPKGVALSGELLPNRTYLNNGSETIVYDTLEIAPGESFEARDGISEFTASIGYSLQLIFDNTEPWIPTKTFGEYFVTCADSGELLVDTNGVPLSSGNPLSFQSPNNAAANVALRRRLTDRYFQVKLYVQSINDYING